MNVVIAGGGTGGHLYPCLAIANRLMQLRAETDILFIGTAAGMEAKAVPQHGFRFAAIRAAGFVGKGILEKIRACFYVPIGVLQSMAHLKRFSPHLVIGIGGYAAGPVLLAAFIFRIKRVILEPNLIPGMMNKLWAPFVHLTVTAFEETKQLLRARKIACLGAPVRQEILAAAATTPYLASPQRGGRPLRGEVGGETEMKTVLILGGSQGAHRINQAMIEALPFLEKMPIKMIHQTGANDFSDVQAAYKKHQIDAEVKPFIEKMAEAYAAADLVVSRAGAGTLSELAVMGLPSLLIPFPYAKGHQEKNAEPFVRAGAAEMVRDHALTGKTLSDAIASLLSDSEKRSKMAEASKRLGHPHAAEEIVAACLELVGNPFSPPPLVGAG